MGMSPTPSIVNLYIAIYEAMYILPLLNSFLFYLKRFIKDGLGIWLQDPDQDMGFANWILFKTLINAMGLRWTSMKLLKRVIFKDMTIKIKWSGLVTALYAKPMTLYHYILPTSCDPPGALTSLMFGQFLQIFQLCLRNQDINSELAAFYYHCLLDRGYTPTSYSFLSKASTMPITTFLSPKPNERKQRRLRWAVQMREYFSISFPATEPILRCHPMSLTIPDSLPTQQREFELAEKLEQLSSPSQ
jgi:hypothetical protein